MGRANASTVALALCAGIFFLLASASASAQVASCFTRTGASASSAQLLVGVGETVRLSAACEYAVRADGTWAAPGALAGRDVDFLEVQRQLAPNASGGADPRVLYGRERAHPDRRGTLMLRYCAHYLLEEQLGFRVIPSAGGGSFVIERVRPADCDAEALELRAVRGAGQPRVRAGGGDSTLGAGQASLTLTEGDWSIYAARPGSGAGLRVGVFRSQRVVTPLARHLRAVGAGATEPPLLAARWDVGGPGLLLTPTPRAADEALLWPELRTAADAGLLWIARPQADAPPQIVGHAQLEGGEHGAVRLPDSVVRDVMTARYGEAASGLAPSRADWRAVLSGLSMCLTPSYLSATAMQLGAAVPDPASCAAIDVLALIAPPPQGQAQQACLTPGMQVITASGVRQEQGAEQCFEIPAASSAAAEPLHYAVAGDRLTLRADGLCVLIDDAPLEPNDEGEYVLRSGLLEVRQSGGPTCTGQQGLARLRVPVIDPEREWHPVGLYTGGSDEAMSCGQDEAGRCPWRALAHDESYVFSYVEPRHELVFSLSTSPQVAAAINAAPDAAVQITEDVPLLSGVSGQLEGARPPALVAYASRADTCPDATVAELRARAPMDPDALLADDTFHVFLIAVTSLDEPGRCLARASFRNRPSRALVAETVEDFLGLELGLLGDTQAVFFANDPIALGLALPLVWFRMTPGIRFIALEVTGSLVMAAAFDPAELSRLGVALTWALSFGIPEHLPRILSVGGMLHGAAETSTVDNPIVSFFVGLNLSSLVDLAGGR